MTEEQFREAEKIMKNLTYYKNIADAIENEQFIKKREDVKASNENHRWTLLRYFTVRFHNRETTNGSAVIGVRPHYEFSREIEIDADIELIDLIREWAEKKKKTLEEKLKEI